MLMPRALNSFDLRFMRGSLAWFVAYKHKVRNNYKYKEKKNDKSKLTDDPNYALKRDTDGSTVIVNLRTVSVPSQTRSGHIKGCDAATHRHKAILLHIHILLSVFTWPRETDTEAEHRRYEDGNGEERNTGE